MGSEANKYEIDMCSGSILKKMLAFTIPLMFSSILQLLFNAADIVVVGKFAGDNSLAAVGSNTALINLLTNLFVGLSIGANVTAARFYGAKRDEDLSDTVHTSMAISLISGIFLTVVGILGARQMLEWMQTPEEVIDLASLYLRIYFIGMTSNMVYNFGSALLRAVGDTKRPLYYLIAAGIINIILNLIFVIVFKMDVAGVALATIISETVSAVLVVRCLMKETGAIKLILKKLRIDSAKLGMIMRIGLPAGFQGIVFALSNVVIQSSVNIFGNIVDGGNSAAANIEGFVYISMNALYQTSISFTSQNLGAKNYHRIDQTLVRCMCIVTLIGLVLGNGAHLLGNHLLHIYSDDLEVISFGMQRLSVISVTYCLCGMMDVLAGTIRGMGYSMLPMIVSLIGACVFRIIWIFTVFRVQHTLFILYASYPISWILTILAHFVCYLIVRKKVFRPQET